MGVYDQISQGITPIGADLPQVAGMLDAKSRFQQMKAMQQEQISYDRGRDAKVDARLDAAAQSEGQRAQLTQALSRVEWALQSGNPRAALLSDDEAVQNFEAQGIDLNSISDEQATQILQGARTQFASQLGIRPESDTMKPPTSFQEFDLARKIPEYADHLEAERKKGGVQVNVGADVRESESDKVRGRLEGEGFVAIIERGQAAAEKASSLRALRDNPAITGPTQDVRAGATALFAGLGIPVSEERLNQVANLGQYKAIANQLVLTEQLKQKGPQTESDAKRIAESFGRSANLQETNRLIMNYQLALAEREGLLAEMAEEYEQRTGTIEGWRKELRSYVTSTPLAGVNPTSKRLVFWNEFVEAMREDNPGMSEEEVMGIWRERYGGSR